MGVCVLCVSHALSTGELGAYISWDSTGGESPGTVIPGHLREGLRCAQQQPSQQASLAQVPSQPVWVGQPALGAGAWAAQEDAPQAPFPWPPARLLLPRA